MSNTQINIKQIFIKPRQLFVYYVYSIMYIESEQIKCIIRIL